MRPQVWARTGFSAPSRLDLGLPLNYGRLNAGISARSSNVGDLRIHRRVISFLHQVITNINPILLDPPAHIPAALPRRVAEAGDRPRRAEVEHEAMRMIRLRPTPFRVPEVRRLTVDRVFRRAVFLRAFLAIDVSNRPA